jgi:hypothetical protein
MSNDTFITDDYVADLLAKEAHECSIKYSALGLDAFKTSKYDIRFRCTELACNNRVANCLFPRPTNKAKPNTRFLRHIIKETKNHNEALLAKEASESQARLNDLTAAEENKQRRLKPGADDIRRRQLGDITAILSGRKRKLEKDEEKGSTRDGPSARDSQDRKLARRDHKDRGEDRHSREDTRSSRDQDRHAGRNRDGSREKERRHRRKSRSRSRSPRDRHRRYRQRSHSEYDDSENDDVSRKSHSRKSGRHTASSRDDLLNHPSKDRAKHGRLAHASGSNDTAEAGSGGNNSKRKPSDHSRHKRVAHSENDDSDPLEDLIGPLPPPKPIVRGRGRGAFVGSSSMDKRFSEDYDPKCDGQPDPSETDDWDEAVETFRDRLKWKQQGADRLREAGFTTEQIKKWESGGEKDIDDVRWSRAGEGREWDRGKVVGDDDTTRLMASWKK